MTEYQNEINRITQNVSDTYAVLNDLGATVPAEANSDNLPGTAGSVTAVLYGKAQSLTDEQKAQARENIGVGEDGGNEIVSMTAEEYEALTTEEKAALYADGVRAIAVDHRVDVDNLTDRQKFVNFAFPVGSCYTTMTNNNPANILGIGNWELIDKVFSIKTANSGFFAYNTTNATAAKMWMVRNGHSIRVRLEITTAVALADSTLALGTLDMAELGYNGLYADLSIVGLGDGANGFSNARVISSTGVLNHYDCVTKTSEGSLTAGNSITYDFILHPDITKMLDSACDKFVWLRTA